MSLPNWTAVEDENGKVFIVNLIDEVTKVKGLGVFNPCQTLEGKNPGDDIIIGQKSLKILALRLPELYRGMKRRAQTISAKDAGIMITKLGIGPGDTVLEAGLGSGGLSLHLARVMGNSGTLITVETREEHAEIGLENLQRAKLCFPEFPYHKHISGDITEPAVASSIASEQIDAIILDLPDHQAAITAIHNLLKPGCRIACYCPVTSQIERAWEACEANDLEVEWAGELMERQWGRASKGGIRPVNGPFGHTAFLLIAKRI